MPRTLAPLLLVGALVASPASAILIPIDLDGGSGDQLLTLDTNTNLAWLDLTLFQGVSAVELPTHELAPGITGQTFLDSGFRYATGLEVCGFFSAYAGAPASCPDPSPEQLADGTVDLLMGMLGSTGSLVGDDPPNTPTPVTRGFYNDGAAVPGALSADVNELVGAATLHQDYSFSSPDFFDRASVVDDDVTAGAALPTLGHFLVVDLPEPSTASHLLVGFGIVALLQRIRRRS